MKKRKNIVLTFDHELFLGQKSGTPDKCMFLPFAKLQDLYDELGITNSIFFLDTTYLLRLKSEISRGNIDGASWNKLKTHFNAILSNGHSIFPHIHPHWLDAQLLDSGEWNLTNFKKYCFKNCTEAEQNDIWKKSMDILNEIGVSAYHPIDSFRAGGWGIQPFEQFKKHFKEHSILHDFSVMPGTFSNSTAQQYDFTEVEWKPFYRFSEKVEEESENGAFYEFPISVRTKLKRTLKEKLWLKYLWKSGNRSFGDGIGAVPDSLDVQPKMKPKPVEMISIELLNTVNVANYRKMLDEQSTIQFLSHPKMLTEHSIKTFKKLMKYALDNYDVNFDFRNIISNEQ